MTRKAKRELKEAKSNLAEAKQELSQAKSQYRLVKKETPKYVKATTPAEEKYLKQRETAKQSVAKDKVKQAKYKKKEAVRRKKIALDRTGGSLKKKVSKKGYRNIRTTAETVVQDNEILGEIASSRQKIRQTNANIQRSKRIARYTAKVGTKTGKGIYSLSNRTYNLARGRRFTRTVKANRWETKVAKHLKKLKTRVMANKHVKRVKTASKWGGRILRPLKAILTNPLSLKAYLVGFVLVCIVALFGGNTATIEQDEFELSRAWLHVSQLDREKSTDKVDYWTNIDEIMMYMNYRYNDYSLDKRWINPILKNVPGQGSQTYKDALSSIWNNLNDDTDNLKKMSDLYGKDGKSTWIQLPKADREEYLELLEQGKEIGPYASLQELENPFYAQDDVNYTTPLKITKRFGYTSKDKIYNGSVLQAGRGQKVLATLSGTIEVKKDEVHIKTSDKDFIYKNLSGLRYKTGDKVEAGQEIGKLDSDNGLTVYYQKLEGDEKQDKWTYVNVGFCFQFVEYTQTTSVISNLDFSGDMASKVKTAYDLVKKYEPNATINGMASMFRNFWTESSITAKRAEGDYLNPPIGASASSWDDPTWLAMNGPSIYGGSYPNILRRGLGLGQWTDTADGSTRHTLLLNYAAAKGKKWYDLELQIDFIFNGDAPYYTNIARSILTSNEDVATLTKRFLVNWEGNPGDKLAERQNNAKQIADYLKNPSSGGGSKTLVASWNFPEAYRSKLTSFPSSSTVSSFLNGNTYPMGQCTWYTYNRLAEAGKPHFNWLGNGQDWVGNLIAKGWKFSATPKAGAVMSESGGQYGHVAYVEYVNLDGSFLVSECNYLGVQDKIHWRVCANVAPNQTFAIAP
ncbi:CHAP domain-containing protein [Streptococcus gallolyticus]|nr:CHAP domain-containing protein [Streptococcus gallolyticus]MBY5041785.1 CHAP domain-containing protein [Streptococcus gallolyticus]